MLRTTGGKERKGNNATGRKKECVITGGCLRAGSMLPGGVWVYSVFTPHWSEEGHDCVLSTVLMTKDLSKYNALLSWRCQTLNGFRRSFCEPCSTFPAPVPIMDLRKVSEMDFSRRCAAQHTLPTAADGPVCVGAVPPALPLPRCPTGARRGTKLRRYAVESHRCGGQLRAAPAQTSSVTFDFVPIRHLTSASAIPALGFSSFTCGLSQPSTPARYARPPRRKPQNITGLAARTIVGRALGDL